MSHEKTWSCINPTGDGCDGNHTTTPRPTKTYGHSAFERTWKKHRDSNPTVKRTAKFWFHEGMKELQRIQCARIAREAREEKP